MKKKEQTPQHHGDTTDSFPGLDFKGGEWDVALSYYAKYNILTCLSFHPQLQVGPRVGPPGPREASAPSFITTGAILGRGLG